MTIHASPSRKRSLLLPLCASAAFVLLVGCSTTSKPVAEISAAKTSLMAAEGEDTQMYAPVALDRAKEKLKRAEASLKAEDFDGARRLAEEARADAELAQATSAKSSAEKAVQELEDSIRILREEIERAQSR